MFRAWDMKTTEGEPDSLDLYIYSTVERAGWFSDGECSAENFRNELEKHANAKEIRVYINSLGGDVMEGTAIYNQLRRHKAHKTVYIDGFACSIASVIAMAGDTVVMPENAVMMVHEPWTFGAGNAAQLRKTADDLDKLSTAIKQAYLVKAGGKLTDEKITELMKNETYLTSAECIGLGLADTAKLKEPDRDDVKEQTEKLTAETIEQAEKQAFENELARRRERALAAVNKYFNRG